MSRAAIGIAAAAVLLLLPLAAATPAGKGEHAGATGLRPLVRPGENAPAFSLEDLDGRKVAVRPGGGKPSLLVFFSAFCPLCRELAPSIAKIAARRGGTIRFIGINLDGKRFTNAVRSFVNEYGFRFPVLLDEIRDDLFLASDAYGVEKTPTVVIVDGRGSVRGSYANEAARELVRDFDRIGAELEKGHGETK